MEDGKPTQDRNGEQPGRVSTAISGLGDLAHRQVNDQLTAQLGRAADSIERIRGILARTGKELGGAGLRSIGEPLGQASGVLGGLAGYLRESDLDSLLSDVERFARRQPAVFLGGCFALGFILARVVKTSGKVAAAEVGT